MMTKCVDLQFML